MRIKSWDHCEKGVMYYPPSRGVQPERQLGRVSDAYERQLTQVTMRQGKILESTEQIVQTVMGTNSLVSHTEFQLDTGDRVQLQYPVKSVNASDRDGFYQVDTGPVLFPDMTIGHDNFMGNFCLAFIAHNCPDWAEFILNVPTHLTEEISVNHYSKPVRVTAKNMMIEVQDV